MKWCELFYKKRISSVLVVCMEMVNVSGSCVGLFLIGIPIYVLDIIPGLSKIYYLKATLLGLAITAQIKV